MATAVALGSILASGAGAASAGGLIAATGVAGVSFGTIATGLGLVGTALSIFGGQEAGQASFDSAIAASRAELDAARTRAAQTGVEIQQAETQAAIEDAERQRRLRRTLASQRAAFAGGSIDPFSGSPVAIQDDTAGEINRESRLADFATQNNTTSLSIQQKGQLATGLGNSAQIIGKANTALAASNQQTTQNIVGLGTSLLDFNSTLKKDLSSNA